MSHPAYQMQFTSVVERIFNRWTALQLAINNGMGGHNPKQTAEMMTDYITGYCLSHQNLDVGELKLILDDIMNEEFDTICEDNSTQEIAESLVKYICMCRSNMVAEMMMEVASLSPCRLDRSRQQVLNTLPIQPNEVIHDDDELCEEDEESNQQDEPMEEDVEPGWTVVKTKRK